MKQVVDKSQFSKNDDLVILESDVDKLDMKKIS